MTIALPHSHFCESHLAKVKLEMETLGEPTIRAVWLAHHNMWQALEGCHRIRAAQQLGLSVDIDPVDYSDDHVSTLGMDGDFLISEACDDAHSNTLIKLND